MNGFKRRIIRPLTWLGAGALVLCNILGLLGPSVANAYVLSSVSGAVGYVNPSGMAQYGTCRGRDLGTAQVFPFGQARVYAASAYRDSNQTFYSQPVLERYVNNTWTSRSDLGGAVGPWTSRTLPAHQGIPWIGTVTNEPIGYREMEFGGGWNVQPGYYRIRYEFRWYVGATLIGWARNYGEVQDIYVFGDRATVTRGMAPSGAAFCRVW